jgi:hypothetical protein
MSRITLSMHVINLGRDLSRCTKSSCDKESSTTATLDNAQCTELGIF